MKLRENFTSIRQFNKCRKQYPLGKDSKGKQLYPWDYVKIYDPVSECTWCSQIYYDHLYGAYIDANAIQIKYNCDQNYHIFLYEYLKPSQWEEGRTVTKITEEDFAVWVERERVKESIRFVPPRDFYLPETDNWDGYDDLSK